MALGSGPPDERRTASPAGRAPDMDVVFLGTGARWPTPERGAAATLIARGAEHLLFDCGEGTQLQMMRSTAGLGRLTAIALTHLHGDHVLGLPGLLATLGDGRRAPLRILGPPGTAALVGGVRPLVGDLEFPLEIREMDPGDAELLDGYRLVAAAGRHRVPSLAWCLQEDELPGHLMAARLRRLGVPPGPAWRRLALGGHVTPPGGGRVSAEQVTGPARPGRRVVLSGDTRPTAGVAAIAAGADLLVHEATFLERDRGLADRSGHSTAADAARLAAAAGVGLLALTHRSTRYPREDVLAEARAVFPATVAPEDLDLVHVPLPERGRPRLIPGGAEARGCGSPAAPDRSLPDSRRARGGDAPPITRREDVMARIDDPDLATQAEELAGLVAGREPEDTVARLHAVAQRIARGELPDHSDLSLFERMRARYGRELAELTRPEPW
ncbi:MAG TPA: ribonuclease Z [Miltoncostaeaceae bacterium]|nr:ribonuclease Z [Miltoncostaeaceae bacterium]